LWRIDARTAWNRGRIDAQGLAGQSWLDAGGGFVCQPAPLL
jgi:hypothetical protein